MLRQALLVSDVTAAAVAGALASLLGDLSPGRSLALSGGLILAWPAAMLAFGLYSVDGIRAWATGLAQLPRLLGAALVLSWPLYLTVEAVGAHNARGAALAGTAALAAVTLVLRALARMLAHRARPLRQRALIVGSGLVAGQVVRRLRAHDEIGVDPIGIVDDEMSEFDTSGLPRLGRIEDVPALIDDEAVDRVVISFSRASHHGLLECIRSARERGVAVDVVPRLFEFLEGATTVDAIRGLPLLSLDPPVLPRYARAAKRALDIVVSALALLLLSPLLLWIAVAIKLDSPGPVFFRQRRAGRDGKPFEVMKFRTMALDAEQRKRDLLNANNVTDGVMFKMWLDPRTTRVGKKLRRLSLDELPQLVNVLRGQMSLVGPRPLVFEEALALAEAWEARRLDLKPGLTGPWQVAGRNHVPFQDMLRLDYQYVAGWSLARDVEILLATIPAVLSRRGAY